MVAEIAFGENPLAFRATGLLPPALGKTNDRLSPDVERARADWQEAGGYDQPMSILYSPAPRPYLPAPAAVARHLRDRFRRLGATVEAVEVSSGELIAKVNSGDYDLALMGNIPDSPDPSDYLSAVIGSDAVPEGVEGRLVRFQLLALPQPRGRRSHRLLPQGPARGNPGRDRPGARTRRSPGAPDVRPGLRRAQLASAGLSAHRHRSRRSLRPDPDLSSPQSGASARVPGGRASSVTISNAQTRAAVRPEVS